MAGEVNFDVGSTGATERCFGDSKKCDVGRQYALELVSRGALVVANELDWVGMEVAHYCATPAFEVDYAGHAHHVFTLFTRPPDEYAIRFGEVTRHLPPPDRKSTRLNSCHLGISYAV